MKINTKLNSKVVNQLRSSDPALETADLASPISRAVLRGMLRDGLVAVANVASSGTVELIPFDTKTV
jgi:hypothetical protein